MHRWIDISVPLHNTMHHWPGEPPHFEQFEFMERGDMCNVTRMKLSVHTGTHMDSPRHFIPDGVAMEALPLDAVLGPATVVEIDDPVAVRARHLEGLALEPRVLFKTRNSARCWQQPGFVEDFVYIARDAASVLAARGIKTVGIDYLSIGGFHQDLVETHNIILGAGIWVIEGLNLAHIAPGRYELACLPLNIVGSDGAPARAALRRF
jgi:arylformamidase